MNLLKSFYKSFEIDNIEFAQSIFLQRNNYNNFKNIVSRFHHEEEIISISNKIIETYSSFRYDTKTYTFYCDLDLTKNKQPYENLSISKTEKNLIVGFKCSDFEDRKKSHRWI